MQAFEHWIEALDYFNDKASGDCSFVADTRYVYRFRRSINGYPYGIVLNLPL